MWKIIVLYIIIALTIVQGKTYENYKVFTITPTAQDEIELLNVLETSSIGIMYWKQVKKVGSRVDIMIAPNKINEFYNLMEAMAVPFDIIADDVQILIDSHKTRHARMIEFNFERYHTLQEIYEDLDDLAKQYPDKVQTVVGGQTYQGREIKGVKVKFRENNPGIFIEGGIHSNEWISPATVMFILHQLLTSNDTNVRKLAETHNWYIFPLFNPDGYEYTHTTDRLWRKNLKPHYNSCIGVNLDGNWENIRYCEDSNRNPCSENYIGTEQFSEIEAKSISEYIHSISHKLYAYISFHSYGQSLFFPYNSTKKHLQNYQNMLSIAKSAAKNLKMRYGTDYSVEHISNITHIIGCTVNYIKNTYDKPLVFEYHLRDRDRYGFLLPPEQIIPTGEETLDSLVGLFKKAKKYGYTKVFHTSCNN